MTTKKFSFAEKDLELVQKHPQSGPELVTKALFFKINGFSMISKREDGYQYGHDMFHGCLWKDPAQTCSFIAVNIKADAFLEFSGKMF